MGTKLEYAQWLIDNKREDDPDKYQTVLDAYEFAGGGGIETEDLSVASNVPLFQMARKNGFVKGYLDQASGIAQIAERLKIGPDMRNVALRKAELSGSPGLKGIKAPSIDDFIRKEEVEYQQERIKAGDTGIDWSRMAGNIMNPVSVATMAVPISAGATLPAKMGHGAIAGGIALGSHPVLDAENYKKSKAAQVAGGTFLGGAIPAAMVPLKGAFDLVKYLARPFNQAGQLADLKKVYLTLAGDARKKIIRSLENSVTHIKGSKPTSAQAIAEGVKQVGDDGLPINFGGGIVKLEQELSKKVGAGDTLKTIYGQQAARRSQTINNLIDSGEDALTNAINKRAAVTKPYYDMVENSTKRVNVKDVLTNIKKHLILNRNEDSVTLPLARINEKIMATGTPESSPQALHSLSKHISNLMSKKTPGGQNEFDVKVLNEVKAILDKQIGKAEPAYRKARDLYSQYSTPVNQIEVSRSLGKALQNAVEEESPTQFLRAIEDAPKLLKRSTGFSRYKKLSDVMNKNQIKEINQVKEELLRQAKERNLAAKTTSVVSVLEGQIEPSLPNMLSRPMMLANAILAKIGTNMGPKYEALAVSIQKDPKVLAEILKLPADHPRRKMMAELLTRFSAMIPAQGIAPEVAREF